MQHTALSNGGRLKIVLVTIEGVDCTEVWAPMFKLIVVRIDNKSILYFMDDSCFVYCCLFDFELIDFVNHVLHILIYVDEILIQDTLSCIS